MVLDVDWKVILFVKLACDLNAFLRDPARVLAFEDKNKGWGSEFRWSLSCEGQGSIRIVQVDVRDILDFDFVSRLAVNNKLRLGFEDVGFIGALDFGEVGNREFGGVGDFNRLGDGLAQGATEHNGVAFLEVGGQNQVQSLQHK